MKMSVVAGLRALQDYHGVVLHPTSSEIWVQSAKGSWWASCGWCSSGVATLVGDVIYTCSTMLQSVVRPACRC